MMHVLFVAGWYPYKGYEHFGVFIQEHAEAVKKHVDLSVVHLRVEKSYKHFPWYIEINKHDRDGYTEYEVILHMALRRFGLHDRMVINAYDKAIRKIQEQKAIDLVHLNVRMHLTKLLPQVPSIQHLPIVLTEHFTYYHTGINRLPDKDRKAEKEDIRQWFQNPQIKKVMPVSQELAHVLHHEYGVAKGNIDIIGNVANPVFSYKPKCKTKEKIRTTLVANWGINKNPLLFLEALKSLPKHKLSKLRIDWVGDGELMPKVRKFVDENLPYIDIAFHGVRSKSFIASTLQEADFLTHPTNAENLPCIIIESLCCGTPVVSNSVNGVPELIDESNGLLSPKKDVTAFKKNLEYMIDFFYKYDNEAIAYRAHENYSMERIGQKIFQTYKLINNNF